MSNDIDRILNDSYSPYQNNCGMHKPKKTHAAFAMCEKWGENVHVNTPTKYTLAVRNDLESEFIQAYCERALKGDNFDAKISAIEILKFRIDYDKNHLSSIMRNVYSLGNACLILTEHDDLVDALNSIGYGRVKSYDLFNTIKIDRNRKIYNRIDSPTVITYRQYFEDYEMLSEYPVHFADFPSSQAVHGRLSTLFPFKQECHIYPVMGNVYSKIMKYSVTQAFYSSGELDDIISSALIGKIKFPGETSVLIDRVRYSIRLAKEQYYHLLKHIIKNGFSENFKDSQESALGYIRVAEGELGNLLSHTSGFPMKFETRIRLDKILLELKSNIEKLKTYSNTIKHLASINNEENDKDANNE